jgi:RNA polymerase sigma-70 factor, ECF subfamily
MEAILFCAELGGRPTMAAARAFFLMLWSGEWNSAWLFFTEKPQEHSLTGLHLQAKCSIPIAGERVQENTGMDEQQFHALYEATARPIHAYLVAVAGSKDTADDVLQETYFRFLARRPRGLALEETRPYLFSIATNLVRDRWRARREEPWPEHFEQADSPDLNARLDMHRMMQALKPRERELLWLAYVEGMTHAEIAAATGLTPLSVRPLLFRARKRAAAVLQPEKRSV